MLVGRPPALLTALTLLLLSHAGYLLTSLLVQCPTITTLDLFANVPLGGLSPPALPGLRKLTPEWLHGRTLWLKDVQWGN